MENLAPVDGTRHDMHQNDILMHMRTTMILNETLIDEARRLTGLTEKTAIVHAGLEALIARESARRLAELGGTMPDAAAGRRRRSAPRRKR
jgi:Arc/MetJ family transcription regulator